MLERADAALDERLQIGSARRTDENFHAQTLQEADESRRVAIIRPASYQARIAVEANALRQSVEDNG